MRIVGHCCKHIAFKIWLQYCTGCLLRKTPVIVYFGGTDPVAPVIIFVRLTPNDWHYKLGSFSLAPRSLVLAARIHLGHLVSHN